MIPHKPNDEHIAAAIAVLYNYATEEQRDLIAKMDYRASPILNAGRLVANALPPRLLPKTARGETK